MEMEASYIVGFEPISKSKENTKDSTSSKWLKHHCCQHFWKGRFFFPKQYFISLFSESGKKSVNLGTFCPFLAKMEMKNFKRHFLQFCFWDLNKHSARTIQAFDLKFLTLILQHIYKGLYELVLGNHMVSANKNF